MRRSPAGRLGLLSLALALAACQDLDALLATPPGASPGADANVAEGRGRPAPTNARPVVHMVTFGAGEADGRGLPIALDAVVSDPDAADALTVTWRASVGTIAPGGARAVQQLTLKTPMPIVLASQKPAPLPSGISRPVPVLATARPTATPMAPASTAPTAAPSARPAPPVTEATLTLPAGHAGRVEVTAAVSDGKATTEMTRAFDVVAGKLVPAFAGIGTLAGDGTPGSRPGRGAAASLFGPAFLAVEPDYSLVVTNRKGQWDGGAAAWRLQPNGELNGTTEFGPGGPMVRRDAAGNTFVALKTLGITETPITRITAEGVKGEYAKIRGRVNAVVVAPGGDLVVATDAAVWRVDPSDAQHRPYLLAGSATGEGGYLDGYYDGARFNQIADLAIAPDGAIYVADAHNQAIRRITYRGAVATVETLVAAVDGPRRGGPNRIDPTISADAVAVDPDGNVYFGGSTISRVRFDGTLEAITRAAQLGGDADGPFAAAKYHVVGAIATTDDGVVYFADPNGNKVRYLY